MSTEQSRFVVQRHASGADVHWDLMLERDGRLETYRLDAPPEQIAAGPVKAERIFDHRLDYLTYEGPVGSGSGEVRICQAGTYGIFSRDDERIELSLLGETLNGGFVLTRVAGNQWELTSAPSAR